MPGVAANPVLQELLIMNEYDYIVTLVDSPGTIAEATLISLKPDLARKSSLFMDDEYKEGLPAKACQLAAELGGHFATYAYPGDLDDCNLYGMIEKRVTLIQTIKYLT